MSRISSQKQILSLPSRFLLILILTALLTLTACEGDETQLEISNANEDIGAQDTLKTGYLMITPIQGARYESESSSGLTGVDGDFKYAEGETVSFYAGKIKLGDVSMDSASGIITPYELADTNDTQDQRLLNITVFLQSIDEDNSNDNGITISQDTIKLFDTLPVDLVAKDRFLSPFDFQELGITLVSEHDAISNLNRLLNKSFSDLLQDFTVEFESSIYSSFKLPAYFAGMKLNWTSNNPTSGDNGSGTNDPGINISETAVNGKFTATVGRPTPSYSPDGEWVILSVSSTSKLSSTSASRSFSLHIQSMPVVPESLSIQISNENIKLGEHATLTALLTLNNGVSVAPVEVVWELTPQIGDGLLSEQRNNEVNFTPTRVGIVRIRATVTENNVTVTQELIILVQPPDLVIMSIIANRSEIVLGGSLQLRVYGEFSDGSQNYIDHNLDYSSSNTPIASVNASGLVTANNLSTGSTIITVSKIVNGSPVTASFNISVVTSLDTVPPVVTSVEITEPTTPTTTNGTAKVKVVGSDSSGQITHYLVRSSDSTFMLSPLWEDRGWLELSQKTSNLDILVEVSLTDNQTEKPQNLIVWLKDAGGNVSNSLSDSITYHSPIDYNNLTLNPFAYLQWNLGSMDRKAGQNVAPVHSTGEIKGRGVRVVVIDDALEVEHEDLDANTPGVRRHINFDPEKYNSRDENGATDPSPNRDFAEKIHGTLVAGVIGMRDNNGLGGIGVAPRSELMGINYISYANYIFQYYALGFYNYQNFNCGEMCDRIEFYNNILSPSNNAPQDGDIFNMSYGSSTSSIMPYFQQNEQMFIYGTSHLRNGKGAVYVKSAGNSFQTLGIIQCAQESSQVHLGQSYDKFHTIYTFSNIYSLFRPCNNAALSSQGHNPYMIHVAATNDKDIPEFYSSASPSLWISAPAGVLTTDPIACKQYIPPFIEFQQEGQCFYKEKFDGTSASAPSISGIAALMLEANPQLTWLDVKHILAETARKPDMSRQDYPEDISMIIYSNRFTSFISKGYEGNTGFNGGFNNRVGWGIADAEAAVAAAKTHTSLGNSLTSVSTEYKDVNDPILNLEIIGAHSTITAPQSGKRKVRFVAVDLDIEHHLLAELTIKLENVSKGMSHILHWAGSGHIEGVLSAQNFRILSSAFYDVDYSSTDQWKLTVFDTTDTTIERQDALIPGLYNPVDIKTGGRFNRWKMTLYTTD